MEESEKKTWDLIIHAFNDQEKFLVARVFRVECSFWAFDRLVQLLSYGTLSFDEEYYRKHDEAIWTQFVYIRQHFTTYTSTGTSTGPITLRTVHFHENK